MVTLKRSGQRVRPWLALVVTGVVLSTSGCSARVGQQRVPPPPVVAVVEARQMTVPIMAEPIGTTRALQEVSIRARVRGFLKERHFEEGSDVKPGQLLFVIDEEPFQAKLDEAQAKLKAATAKLKKARDSQAREVAEAQLALDQATFELNQVEEARQLKLLSRKAASQEDVDQAIATRKRSEAQVQADHANLDQAKADYESNLLGAQAEVAEAEAGVHNAEIDLGYCRMTSPIAGRIGFTQVKLGNLVGPAAGGGGADYTELAVVRQLDPMGIDIQVASQFLDRATRLIAQGLPVQVYRPSLEGDEAIRFPGKAISIDNSINPTTSTFLVRAEVANPAQTILPGEYVKSKAKIGEVHDAIVVPEQAVVETQAGWIVFSVNPKGLVEVVPVKPVREISSYEGLRVLESGLNPGQTVIVEGFQLVQPGKPAQTRPAPPDVWNDPEGPPTGPPAEGDSEPEKSAPPAGESQPKS